MTNIVPVASLFGEPSRAAILTVLLDGRALPAGELARVAGVTPTAASAHLSRLIGGKLLSVRVEGRHRYYCLASAAVAEAIESLAQLTESPLALNRLKLSPAAQALRHARSCYNHLAGELAVKIALALERRGYLRRGEGKRYEIGSDRGQGWFASQGIDFKPCVPVAMAWRDSAWIGLNAVLTWPDHSVPSYFNAGANEACSGRARHIRD